MLSGRIKSESDGYTLELFTKLDKTSKKTIFLERFLWFNRLTVPGNNQNGEQSAVLLPQPPIHLSDDSPFNIKKLVIL